MPKTGVNRFSARINSHQLFRKRSADARRAGSERLCRRFLRLTLRVRGRIIQEFFIRAIDGNGSDRSCYQDRKNRDGVSFQRHLFIRRRVSGRCPAGDHPDLCGEGTDDPRRFDSGWRSCYSLNVDFRPIQISAVSGGIHICGILPYSMYPNPITDTFFLRAFLSRFIRGTGSH